MAFSFMTATMLSGLRSAESVSAQAQPRPQIELKREKSHGNQWKIIEKPPKSMKNQRKTAEIDEKSSKKSSVARPFACFRAHLSGVPRSVVASTPSSSSARVEAPMAKGSELQGKEGYTIRKHLQKAQKELYIFIISI